MSLKVLVIPEDPTYNGAILKPVVSRILEEIGRPKAEIKVLTDPAMKGIGNAKELIRTQVANKWGHLPLWLFIPDADRAGDLTPFEKEMRGRGIPLLCCAARPELEAWALAGYSDRLIVPWKEVAEHPRLKEEVFEPALEEFGDSRLPDQGRGLMVKKAVGNYRGLKKLCPEIAELEQRIRALLNL